MGKTKIQWADKVLNLNVGCTHAGSPGCDNCYARDLHTRRNKAYLSGKKMPEQYSKPFGEIQLLPERLGEPLHWRKPQRIFVNSMSDLFHEDVPFHFIDDVFDITLQAQCHIYMILTKRPNRMYEYFDSTGNRREYLEKNKNIWLGVTAENQQMADERIPILLQIPAAVRFVSIEPMLENINIVPYIGYNAYKCSCGWHETEHDLLISGYCSETKSPSVAICNNCGKRADIYRALDWIICGGETGQHARQMHPDWARSLRDQCVAVGVPFFFKQWGEWKGNYPGDPWEPTSTMPFYYFNSPPYLGKVWRCGTKNAGHLLDGVEWRQFPEVAKCINGVKG